MQMEPPRAMAMEQRVTAGPFHPIKAHRQQTKKRAFGKDLTNQQVAANPNVSVSVGVGAKVEAKQNAKSGVGGKVRRHRGEDSKQDLDGVQKVVAAAMACSVDGDGDSPMVPLSTSPSLPPWDASDVADDLSAAEYAEDIMALLRQQEEAAPPVGDFMAAQRDLNERMRAVLVNWMVEVHRKFQLTEPSYFLAINLVDRFLATKAVKRTRLQLLGCSCLWIASKYHEIYAPEMDDFVYISDGAFSSEQMEAMEVEVLKALSFELTVPTLLSYAERYSKISAHYLRKERERKIISDLIRYCAEHCVMAYALCRRPPSLVGAACFVYSSLSTKVFSADTFRDDGLERVVGYSMDALLPTMRELDAALKGAKRSKHKAVIKKYCCSKHSNVGKLNFRKLDVSFLGAV